ncbi:AraC family transcriptional regulator [Acidisarcina polymorpha]|uniref:AraC family transcriptional regulator n=1 Tax=Acidisarcina polymorpha TaxID=2211140 RepID=UPI001237DF12|nr:AraC family transcriptional regulator [Acidisarcina polymorpha]
MSDSISVRQGSQVIPIVPHVVRRHPSLAVRGVLVEHHAVEPAEFPEREPQQHNFFMYTSPAVRAEIKSPDFSGLRWIRPGALWVMPQGCRHEVRFEGPVEGIALAFEPVRFDHLVESAGGKCSTAIVQSLAASPPKIEHLMRALGHESQLPSTHDHFGLECIATAIALALSQHARAIAIESSKTGARLAPRQIRAVQSYVVENLDQRITLAELAGVAGLSSFHFLRAFKRSLGVTPGQYVLDLRMERARSLLMTSNLTVAEVGVRVGFDYSSHFTRAFRRAIGTAPSTFRNGF